MLYTIVICCYCIHIGRLNLEKKKNKAHKEHVAAVSMTDIHTGTTPFGADSGDGELEVNVDIQI